MAESRKELSTVEEYKAYKLEKHQQMVQRQMLPYDIKVRMARQRIRSFYEEAIERGFNCHVSVGGLDSITLAYLIRDMGFTEEEIPFISASQLEDLSIQKVHKEIGCIVVKPLKSKVKVLQDEGFPVLSKKIANKIDTLAHPSEKNKTIRHAIITGDCGAQGHFATNSKMQLVRCDLVMSADLLTVCTTKKQF